MCCVPYLILIPSFVSLAQLLSPSVALPAQLVFNFFLTDKIAYAYAYFYSVKYCFRLMFLIKANINRITKSSQSYIIPHTSEPSLPIPLPPFLNYIAQCCLQSATHPYILKSLWWTLLTGQKLNCVNLCFHKIRKNPENFSKCSSPHSLPTEDKYQTVYELQMLW